MGRADSEVDTLIAKGTVVLACNMAFSGIVAMLANKEKTSRDEPARSHSRLVCGSDADAKWNLRRRRSAEWWMWRADRALAQRPPRR
jgi:hypothetical protein